MTLSYDTDPDLLVGIQRATTKVLAELHRVCEELGIDYAVYGGTAIGAVRHKGSSPGTTTLTSACRGRTMRGSWSRLART